MTHLYQLDDGCDKSFKTPFPLFLMTRSADKPKL